MFTKSEISHRPQLRHPQTQRKVVTVIISIHPKADSYQVIFENGVLCLLKMKFWHVKHFDQVWAIRRRRMIINDQQLVFPREKYPRRIGTRRKVSMLDDICLGELCKLWGKLRSAPSSSEPAKHTLAFSTAAEGGASERTNVLKRVHPA